MESALKSLKKGEKYEIRRNIAKQLSKSPVHKQYGKYGRPERSLLLSQMRNQALSHSSSTLSAIQQLKR